VHRQEIAPIMGGGYHEPMRVIAKRTLREFYEQPPHRDAQGPLEAWHAEASRAVWRTPHEIKAHYASASFIDSTRVVFNIGGNKYRLLVDVDYARQALYVKLVGTLRSTMNST